MRIIYVHHALRQKGDPPSQEDKIQPLGIKDAEITAELLKIMSKELNFKAIYTSPYYRCAKTSEFLNKHLNVPIYSEPRLNEFTGVFEAVKNGESVASTETWIDCQTRIREAIKDIVCKFDNDDKDAVVCVTSGVNITAFIGVAYKIPVSEELPFPWVPSCSPIAFKIDKSYF